MGQNKGEIPIIGQKPIGYQVTVLFSPEGHVLDVEKPENMTSLAVIINHLAAGIQALSLMQAQQEAQVDSRIVVPELVGMKSVKH